MVLCQGLSLGPETAARVGGGEAAVGIGRRRRGRGRGEKHAAQPWPLLATG